MSDYPTSTEILPMATPASEPHNQETIATKKHAPTKKSFGFFAIIAALALTGLLTSLEATITSTAQLKGGKAYERATKTYMDTITDPVTRIQVESVYVEAIKTVWWVSMAFSALAFLLVIIEREIKLREEVDTKFGQEEKMKAKKSDVKEPSITSKSTH